MEHTFLVKPGAWNARGSFRDAEAKLADALGDVLIVHEQHVWISDVVMRVHTDPVIELRSRYVIQPLQSPHSTTTWTCQHPVLGALYGSFLFSEGRIVCAYSSGSGEYSGFENFTLQSNGCYVVDAALMRGKSRVYSWCLTLARRDR